LGSADLSWNHIAVSPSAADSFSIWMEYPAGNWQQLAMVSGTTFSYQHEVSVCEEQLNFRIQREGPGCTSVSDQAGDVFRARVGGVLVPLTKQRLTPEQTRAAALKQQILEGQGDPYRGRELFLNQCGKCHRLFEQGGSIGPDLTSYKRNDLDTMLLNVLAPSAEIREGFETLVATTVDGRVVTGFLVEQDPHEFRHRHRRVRVVQLDRRLFRQGAPVVVRMPEAADKIGERAGHEEILLQEAQSPPTFGRIVRIQHARE